MHYKDSIFDTLVDTKRIYVSIKVKFVLREYQKKNGLCPILISLTGNGQRERYNMNLDVDPKHFDRVKQRLKPINQHCKDINLILDSVEAKITTINVAYRLQEKNLTPALMVEELKSEMPRVNFVAFFKHVLDEEKQTTNPGTWRRHQSVYKKLLEYKSEILFCDINEEFFSKYRRHLIGLGNKSTTVNSNIISIKKYIRIAGKRGIKIAIDIDDIKGGSTKGNRVFLNVMELKNMYEYYQTPYIEKTYKLVLGYFLFSCFTGLRISDIQNLRRSDLTNNDMAFVTKKTKKDQVISLNLKAQEIVQICPELFEVKLTDQFINRELKKACKAISIHKNISFHVARHTFATQFLKMGGSVQKLQLLLGHSDIKQTMVYVHLANEEANKEIFCMDNLF